MSRFTFNLWFLKEARGAESEAAEFGRDARRDWRLVFISFLVVTALALAFSFFVYARIDKGELFLVDKEGPAPLRTLNRFELEKTVAHFEEKRGRFERLKRAPLSVSDPGPATTLKPQ